MLFGIGGSAVWLRSSAPTKGPRDGAGGPRDVAAAGPANPWRLLLAADAGCKAIRVLSGGAGTRPDSRLHQSEPIERPGGGRTRIGGRVIDTSGVSVGAD